MRIGINLLPLRPGKNGGHEVYLRNLLDNIFKLDTVNEYYLITTSYNDFTLNYNAPNCTKINIHNNKSITNFLSSIYNRLSSKNNSVGDPLTKIIDEYEIDLWFCPFLSLDPRPIKIPGIVSIPDIQHEYFPEYFSKEELALRKSYILSSCIQATKIITVSEFSKRSLIDKLNVDPDKIIVIYHGVGENFNERDENNDIISKYDLPDNYLFYPANPWPHKNHLLLIEAFNLYKNKYDSSLQFVLTGSDLKKSTTIQDLILKYNLEDSIHLLGYVDKDDLPELYRNAKALIFPSLFEGFGIPPLEAMAVGCPVIASNSTSIPEVVGDAAYLFDPNDPMDICNSIHKIMNDNYFRDQLIINGKTRIKQFSYEKAACIHLDLFESINKQFKDPDNNSNNEFYSFYGLYPDGWFPKMEFVYSGERIFRHLHIDLRSELPVKYPMKIKIALNDNKYNIIIPSPGNHSFGFEIPDIGTNPEYIIKIIPNRSYIPKKLGINDDERKISIMLNSFIMTDCNGNSTQYIQKEVK